MADPATTPTDAATASYPGNLTEEQQVHPSQLDEAGMMLVMKTWFRDDSRHTSKWRDEAKRDFEFIAGNQWSPEDQQTLKNQMRPAIVFNRALTIIKCVAGMEINSRHEITFIPRNSMQVQAQEAELLTAASKWMADECDGEDEESTAFQHANICGLGVNEHRLSYEEEAAGKYIEEAIDPLEFYWDCRAKKKNFVDARRLWRARKIPIGDALELFPNFSRAQIDATWALNEGPEEPLKTLEERRIRDENVATQWSDREEVTILCCQWYEKEPYWRVADQATNQTAQLSEKEYQTLCSRLQQFGVKPPPAVKMQRRKYRQAFIGNVVLKMMDAPIPDRFSWTVMTGEIEHTTGAPFGLCRVMRDPQMWSNKWLSQSLHILNTTAKGGILAERDAFEDQSQAEASYAQPQAITWASKGSLSGQKPKIMPKPGGAFPQGHMQLMELAITALRDVTGVNYELIGLKDENQPGILEAQRKQAGMTVLATMFDSLRRARKDIGRIRLFYIQNFLSDGRLIRVVGQDGVKAIPLIREKCVGEYDVIVSDAPSSPNQKEANFAIMMQFLPAFKEQLMSRPDLIAIILEYSPLPQRLVDAIKAALTTPNQQQQQIDQLRMLDAVATIAQKQSVAELNDAKAGATQSTALYDVAMARNLFLKHNGDLLKAAAELQKHQSDLQLRQAEHQTTQATEQAKQQNLQANTVKTLAEAGHSHVKAGVDALTPIHHSDGVTGGPAERPIRTQEMSRTVERALGAA